MPHKELTSKDDFDAALKTPGKYVLIYAYEGEVDPRAEEAAEKHASTTDSYSVDVAKNPKAKEYFSVTAVPTVVIYKDGSQVKKVDGVGPDSAKEIHAFLSG